MLAEEEERKLVVPRSNLQLGNIPEVVWVDPRTYFTVAKMVAGDVAHLVKSLSGLSRALGSTPATHTPPGVVFKVILSLLGV